MDDTTYSRKKDLIDHLASHSAAALKKWGFNRSKFTDLADPGEDKGGM